MRDAKGIHRMASKLSAAFVRTTTKPGKRGDHHGLISRVLEYPFDRS